MPGYGRGKEYSSEFVKDLRVSPIYVPGWYARGGAWPMHTAMLGQMAFDYGAKTIRFADADEAEAKMILAEIRRRFPQHG